MFVFNHYSTPMRRFMTQPGLLTIPEAALYVRHTISTIRAWRLQRRIPFVKFSGRVFVRQADLDALIEGHIVPAKPVAPKKSEVRQ
jgi:excisionase family DNA binding protein